MVRVKMSDFIHFFEEKKKFDHLLDSGVKKNRFEEKMQQYDPLEKIKDKYPTSFFFDEDQKNGGDNNKKLKQIHLKVVRSHPANEANTESD